MKITAIKMAQTNIEKYPQQRNLRYKTNLSDLSFGIKEPESLSKKISKCLKKTWEALTKPINEEDNWASKTSEERDAEERQRWHDNIMP